MLCMYVLLIMNHDYITIINVGILLVMSSTAAPCRHPRKNPKFIVHDDPKLASAVCCFQGRFFFASHYHDHLDIYFSLCE